MNIVLNLLYVLSFCCLSLLYDFDNIKGLVYFIFLSFCIWMFQIDKEVAKLLELKAHLGDDGRPQFVLKTAKVKPVL